MRIVDWNIEWMNNWFVGNNQVAWRNAHTGIANVAALAQRVARVITTLDPDVLTLQEGPSDLREMNLFIADFLADAQGQPLYDQFGGVDGGAQKTYILVKRGGRLQNARLATDNPTSALSDEWLADIDGDFFLEAYDFTRIPLVIDGEMAATNETVRVLTVHTKSKFVNYQRAMWNDPSRRQEFIVAALKNRRRISTEAMRARQYLDTLVEAHADALIIVTGDLNDGPGIDFFEKNYLTHGVADIILGSTYHSDRQFRHTLVGNVPIAQLFTAIFDDFIEEIDNRPLLLDHILVSPALRNRFSNARVAHGEFDAAEDHTRPVDVRDRRPSDHRPILVEIQ